MPYCYYYCDEYALIMRLILITTSLLSCIFLSCMDEVVCNGHKIDHELLKYNISVEEKDTLNFLNNKGEQLTFVKVDKEFTYPRLETCGGFYQVTCECREIYWLEYIERDQGMSFSYSLEVTLNENQEEVHHNMLLEGDIKFYHFRTPSWRNRLEMLEKLESLKIADTVIDGQNLYGVIELDNRLDPHNYNYLLDKAWLLPNVGIIKMWQDSVCWTLEGYQ